MSLRRFLDYFNRKGKNNSLIPSNSFVFHNHSTIKKIQNRINVSFRFSTGNSIKDSMSIGLQSTMRSIKSKSAKVIILANEISPQWFGKHLIAMNLAKNPNTKIIIVPNLKDMTKKVFDIPSIICCLKTEVDSLNEFYSRLNIHEELLRIFYKIRPNADVSKVKKKKKPKDEYVIPPIIYLKKSPTSEPAFVPQSTIEKMEFDESSDFISLAKYDANELEKKLPFPSYRPLKVKKVVGNLNRKGIKNS